MEVGRVGLNLGCGLARREFRQGNVICRQAKPPGWARIPDAGKEARGMWLARLALVRQERGFVDEAAEGT